MESDSEDPAARAIWAGLGLVVVLAFSLGGLFLSLGKPEPSVVVHECWRHPAWVDDLQAVCATEKRNGRILQACGNLSEIWERCNDERL